MYKKNAIKILFLFCLIFILWVTYSKQLLTGIANVLVYEDQLVKSEAIVVLVGSRSGNRMEAAVKLYHRGLGKKLVFSGYQVYPGTYSHVLMKAYAIKLGVPEKNIITSNPEGEISTRGESLSNLFLLKNNNIKNFILVTSAYHTKRSKMMYERAKSVLNLDIKFLVYPVQDHFTPIDGWWKSRAGKKGIFLEFLKLPAYYFG